MNIERNFTLKFGDFTENINALEESNNTDEINAITVSFF